MQGQAHNIDDLGAPNWQNVGAGDDLVPVVVKIFLIEMCVGIKEHGPHNWKSFAAYTPWASSLSDSRCP